MSDHGNRDRPDESLPTGPQSGTFGGGGLFGNAAMVAYARWVIRWRWAIIVATVLVVAAVASGGRFLSFSNDYRVFFSEQNPQLQAYEALQDVYVKDDSLLFVLKPAEGEMFTPEMLGAIIDLTEASWQVPYATRVDSLSNFQHSFADGDDLTVRDLVPGDRPLTPELIADIRAVALAEPLLVNRVISPNATTTAISVTLTFPQQSAEELPRVIAFARELVARTSATHPGLRVALTGVAPLSNAFAEASVADIKNLVPLMYGVLILGLIGFLRSITGTVATVMVIGMSAATAMGLAGWFGIALTPPSVSAPTIILTIAVADSIHILVTMFKEMRAGASRNDALIEAMRINMHPVFLTSLTTVIGFLSLNFSDAPPFRDLGNITAMGVVAAWIVSVVFLPAVMAVLPVRVKAGGARRRDPMGWLAELVIARRKPLLWAMTGTVVVLAAMVPRIELNDQFVNYFDSRIPFRADTDFAMANLSGVYQLNFSLGAGDSGAINDPDFLARVDAFGTWLREQPGVVHVLTLTDVMRRLNRNMHGDDGAWYRLPEARDLAAQYLLLFEMSLPYGLDLNNQINVDKSALRVVATLENITTRDGRALKDRAEDWIAGNLPTDPDAQATGGYVMFSYISERNIKGMLIGTMVALLLISLSLTAALRNLKLGLISLVPNLIPAVVSFGIWSIFVGEVGVASSVVAATSLGIIVDDTVHFLSKYLRARRERGLAPADAVRYAFSTVGAALFVTSVVLVAGFSVLTFSLFELNESLGLLTAIAIAAALVLDFLLLPPLLMTLDKKKDEETDHVDQTDVATASAQ
ncbi:MAG: MMPL family transporter [Alphaproteobacteria bacterium]|nr:MMPL family transporter [Alphaproteobacteria bacterium]MDP6517548.1 MMPL family transporter [Alphaproteobacteria bacterium]